MATAKAKPQTQSKPTHEVADAITAKLTSKGQITIPRQVRERLGLRTGDQVEFSDFKGEFRIRRKFDAEKFDRSIKKWRGYLRLGKTTDEIIEEMRGPVDLN